MEWNIFDEWIDSTLYCQMKDMIYAACSRCDKYSLNLENRQYELFSDEIERTIEEEYGLHYPGEVLERLGERREVGLKQMRALGLALAKTKIFHEDSMFIGNQLPAFLKRLDGISDKEDLLHLGIRYLMDGKAKKESYERLIAYPFREIAEMVFALWILPEDNGLWMQLQSRLNAKLGKERTVSVYENSKVYVWLAQNFQFRVKGYRKKDMDAFKYLMRLPFGNAWGNNETVAKKLLENGYSREEISFLNYLMIQEVRLPGSIHISSITGEKLAIEVCRNFLNAEEEYPQQAYELCSQICAFHKSFNIKINGDSGIAEALEYKVQVKNVKAFQILYPYSREVREWKKIDPADSKWDVLYAWLPKEEYDACITETLLSLADTARLTESLEHYRNLTGKEYEKRFWESAKSQDKLIFRRLADYGVMPVVKLMEQFLEEFRENAETAVQKWQHWLWHMGCYIEGLQSYEAYAALKLFIEEFGVNNLDRIFSVTKIMESCFVNDRNYGYYRYNAQKRLDVFRPFLEAEEHMQLFSWIDEYMFREYTDKYVQFLINVLEKEENLLWFPKGEARDIFLCLQEKKEASELRKIYLTEAEKKEWQDRENFMADRRALKKKIDATKEMRESFAKMIAESRLKPGQFKKIKDFIKKYTEHKKEAEESAASYIHALFGKERVYLYDTEEMKELFELLSILYFDGIIDLETTKEFINKVEELPDEETDSETHTGSE